jgi:large subunit ribosomal protein L54
LKATAAEAAKKKIAPLVKSSIPAGQPLKGLNFLKDRQDPVALADDEYPSWLWTILDRQEKKAEAGAGDLFCMSFSPFLYFIFPRLYTLTIQRQNSLF